MSQKIPTLPELLKETVVIFDGATGTYLQALNLSEDDFAGKDGCNEYLVETRPEVVRDFHAAFLSLGVNCVETDSFGSTPIVLAEYDLAEQAYELNRKAAAIARGVADDFSTPDRPRYVGGSMGPTTKLPTLGHIGFDKMIESYRIQARGLIDGGADFLIIETAQDILQVKSALSAVNAEFARLGRRLPVMVSLTFETTGQMLLGTDMGAALTAIKGFKPDILGMNCATGPQQMRQHLNFLSQHSSFPISALPNAGLPENIGGQTVYPLSPEDFARYQAAAVKEAGVRAVGGCCGTTTEHIRALIAAVEGTRPAERQPEDEAAVSSIYSAMSLHQEPRPFIIGERTNANGSKKFRELLLAEDYDGMVALARDQANGGAHALDVCTAYVGRDEVRDMTETLSRFVQQVKLPLVIDSTSPEVMDVGLKLAGGRCILNSVNFEDGDDKARRIFGLARDHGAAVIALTIDEEGMAKDAARKLAVAERLYKMATEEFGLAPEDLIIDTLTFTVGSGDETLRDAAIQTIDAIAAIKRKLPGVLTVLGVSNISFGLKARSRHILNSVFLRMAIDAGLDMAIIDAMKIIPLNRLGEAERSLAENLLKDVRSAEAPDPLIAYIKHFETAKLDDTALDATDERPLPERIYAKVVDGDHSDLELLLSAALTAHKPLAIINEMLIPAMKEVGELFGSGQMQLPFVLQSAEVMKHAVKFMEPSMEKSDTETKGKLVLATVKGDVHDIGKNLVDILLSNNGYQVYNLGIKVPIDEMLRVFNEEKADAIGMSGLLVKSTVIMKENLEEMKRRGVDAPVLLGGAALTRRYVEEDLRGIYGSQVHYGKDAFSGLSLMGRIVSGEIEGDEGQPEADSTPKNVQATTSEIIAEATAFVHAAEGVEPIAPPSAPFVGTRILELDTETLFPYINETALFRGRWQYRRSPNSSAAEFEALLNTTVRPSYEELKTEVLQNKWFTPRGIYGYLPCYSEGNELVILDEAGERETARFSFPRQRTAPYHAIPSYFLPKDKGPDLFGFFVVTIGEIASEQCQQLFDTHQYLKYLHLHGLSVETAEAGAEYIHQVMRKELGIAADDPQEAGELHKMTYRGSRYSFGYPACPNLDDQFPLFDMLDAARIGVSLSENAQMIPEQSVSAFVVHHPAARYFNPLVGKIQ